MNYTENYQLPQWEETDRVLREDFNEQASVVDQALAQLKQSKYGDDRGIFAFGSYVGDGQEIVRSFDTPFRPSFLILFNQNEHAGQYTYICALGTDQVQCAIASSTGSGIRENLFSFYENGFRVNGAALSRDYGFNTLNVSYQFVAMR